MPDRIAWQPADPAAALARAVTALAEGRLVLLPTESTYEVAASALHPEAVARLRGLAAPAERPALVLTGEREALDWLPFVPGPAARLIRKDGPGPWKVESDGGAAFGLVRRLPTDVQAIVCPERHVALRQPEHAAWAWASRLLRGPLVCVSTPEPTADVPGDAVAAVIDAGSCRIGVPPTHVRVTGKEWSVVREGGLSAADVEELILTRIVFVCTGNTCRSPMAEAICAKLLAERLRCAPGDLRQRGFLVQSAGLAAMMGGEAAPEAVRTVQEWGADLSQHRSQPLTLDLYSLADHVFVMTEGHLRTLWFAAGPGLPTPQLLSPEGDDVCDPIGAEVEVYQECARVIRGHLERRLPELFST